MTSVNYNTVMMNVPHYEDRISKWNFLLPKTPLFCKRLLNFLFFFSTNSVAGGANNLSSSPPITYLLKCTNSHSQKILCSFFYPSCVQSSFSATSENRKTYMCTVHPWLAPRACIRLIVNCKMNTSKNCMNNCELS